MLNVNNASRHQKVKFFMGKDLSKLENEINAFLSDENVILHDIKHTSCYYDGYSYTEAMIIYSTIIG